MKLNTETIKYYSDLFGLPESAAEDCSLAFRSLDSDGEFSRILGACLSGETEYNDTYPLVGELAKSKKINEYTAYETMILLLCDSCRKAFKDAGYDDALFVESLRDVAFKNRECRSVYGVNGVFAVKWYGNFFRVSRFKLGRLQYEIMPYKGPDTTVGGIDVHEGDDVIKIHIPSSGEPFTGDACLDSYKKAFRFFGGKPGEKCVFHCISWLLYPEHRYFLKPGNIVRFLDDFKITMVKEYQSDPDLWRVFGTLSLDDPASLPDDSSLRRSYKERMLSGRMLGKGFGVFAFDGEHVITE